MPNSKYFDSALKRQLSDFESDDLGISWDDFNAKKRRKRRVIFFFRSIAATLLLLLIGSMFFYYNQNDKIQQNTLNNQNTINNNKQPNIDLTQSPEANSESNSIKPKVPNELNPQKNFIIEKEPIEKVPNKSNNINPLFFSNQTNTDFKNNPTESFSATEITDPNNNSFSEDINKSNNDIDKNYLDLILCQMFKFKIPENTEIENPVTPEKITNTEAPTPFKPQHFIAFAASIQSINPNLSISNIGKAFIHKDYSGIRNTAEKNKTGFEIGIHFGKIHKRFDYSIGLQYNQFKTNNEYNFNYSERPIIDIDGKIIGYNSGGNKEIKFKSTQKLSLLSVPLHFNYYFKARNPLQNNFRGLHFGIIPQFIQKIEGDIPNAQFLDQKENMSSENFQTRMMGLEFGLVFKQQLKSNLHLHLLPYYRLNSGLKQTQSLYKTNMNVLGIKCQMVFGL